MDNLFTPSSVCSTMSVSQERSERAVLQEQLKHWRRMKQMVCDSEAAILRRLAEIERATVERERAEAAA
jgi:predicted transcriptional regulator